MRSAPLHRHDSLGASQTEAGPGEGERTFTDRKGPRNLAVRWCTRSGVLFFFGSFLGRFMSNVGSTVANPASAAP